MKIWQMDSGQIDELEGDRRVNDNRQGDTLTEASLADARGR